MCIASKKGMQLDFEVKETTWWVTFFHFFWDTKDIKSVHTSKFYLYWEIYFVKFHNIGRTIQIHPIQHMPRLWWLLYVMCSLHTVNALWEDMSVSTHNVPNVTDEKSIISFISLQYNP